MPANNHVNKPIDIVPSRPSRDMSLRLLVASGSLLPSTSHTPDSTATFPQLQLGIASSRFTPLAPEEQRHYLLGVLNSALAIVNDIDALRGEEEEHDMSRRAND